MLKVQGYKEEQNSRNADADDVNSPERDIDSKNLQNQMTQKIRQKINPIRILTRTILGTDSTQIMIEGTKAIKNLAKNRVVIDMLMGEKDLINIFKNKFVTADTQSQEYILETISLACQHQNFARQFVLLEEFCFFNEYLCFSLSTGIHSLSFSLFFSLCIRSFHTKYFLESIVTLTFHSNCHSDFDFDCLSCT